jgi:predicted NBD/HSP70 family sugar kinase
MSAKVTNQRHAASLININKSLTDLRDKLKILYEQLIRWRATAEFQVTDKENRVSEEEMRRKALKKAYSVFQAAKKIFRGDPVANQIYDQTLEYLADDAGQMLGEMEDFNRLANKLMTNMDLETGAINDEAIKQLSEFQQKLLPASVSPAPGGIADQASAIPARKDDYSDLIK